jgi:hypothetical protein
MSPPFNGTTGRTAHPADDQNGGAAHKKENVLASKEDKGAPDTFQLKSAH